MATLPPPLAAQQPTPARPGVPDPWAWLEEAANPATQAHIAREAAYCAQYFAPYQAQQEALYQAMVQRLPETDCSVPCRDGDYRYYWRSTRTSEYGTFCRQGLTEEAPEEILLDENAWAGQLPYFDLGDTAISPDGRYLAMAIDCRGDERYVLYIRDLHQQRLLPERHTDIAPSLAWSADSRCLYYLRLSADNRPYRCFRHNLGQLPTQDTLLYTEWDERFFLDVALSKSQQFVFLSCESKLTTEWHTLPATDNQATWQCFQARQHEVRYYLDHHGEAFFVLSNQEGAKQFALWQAPIHNCARPHWQLRLAHRADVTLEAMEMLRDYVVVTERHQALLRFHVLNRSDPQQDYHLDFAEPVYSVAAENNLDPESNCLRYSFETLAQPEAIYDCDLTQRSHTLLKQAEVVGAFQSSAYCCERLMATALDGSAIPISLVYHRDFPPTTTRPMYLTGYGAYGISMDVWFSRARLNLLDRGVTFAIAHVRGGGDCGETWHEQGRGTAKSNTFDDFAYCAQHLCRLGYTAAEQLAIAGGSAGGLLVGAVLNRYPGLCRLAIAQVPFVDVLNTMLNPELPLTVTEYEEWGNPHEEEAYARIRSYSPYENVQAQAYPQLYVTCGLHDTRVSYWEALKWSQAIRHRASNAPLVLVSLNAAAGHAGASGQLQALQEVAEEQVFVLAELGLLAE